MANLLEQAIDCDDADRAARIIQNARLAEADRTLRQIVVN